MARADHRPSPGRHGGRGARPPRPPTPRSLLGLRSRAGRGEATDLRRVGRASGDQGTRREERPRCHAPPLCRAHTGAHSRGDAHRGGSARRTARPLWRRSGEGAAVIPPQAYDRLGEIAWLHAPPAQERGDGARIGRYRLENRIGAGSAGVVFRALDPEGQAVAVKLLRRRRGTRYLREIELLERTSERPGVVALLDAGRCDRGPYLVLELAEGGSLRSVLSRRGRLPWRRAAEIVLAVAESLAGLHEEGIIHRDLKPENILLQGDGRPLISDFGLAKDLDAADGELTSAGIALGTMGYMAPELIDGTREELGPWTDVFALGAVLFELVHGRPPFSGKNLRDAARSVREDEVPPLRAAPRALSQLVRRCLAKSPAGRYRSARELSEALSKVLAAQPPPADAGGS
ncbi:MAG: serine/threonine protein kinase [Planctomycetota bacterium]|nr:MAG: serine/threonine protein kinase [Planctomycetota bacterium]